MTANENAINWFEISVKDINRARTFYETIFGIKMEISSMTGVQMAFFPYTMGSGNTSGCLAQSDSHKPSADGVKLYLNGNPDLAKPLSKVIDAGGKVLMPKTMIRDDIGYMAYIIDTEGNVVALHSQK